MRPVGPITQDQLDAQVFTRAVRCSIYDELGTELPIPIETLIEFPKPQTDLDQVTWRLNIGIVATDETIGKVLRGRTIAFWDVFAPGEDLALFTGYLAEVVAPKDWSDGYGRAVYQCTCVGTVGRKWDGRLTRFDWAPTGVNPAVDNESGIAGDWRLKLTGIVKRYRLTMTYTHNATRTTTTGAANSNSVAVTSAAGFGVGDTVYLSNGHRVKKLTIQSIGAAIFFNETISNPATYFPAGSILSKASGPVLLLNFPYFPDLNLESWVKVYKADGTTVMTANTDYKLNRDVDTGIFTFDFITTPGATFTVDMYAVDRWVLLNHRRYLVQDTGTPYMIVPSFYVLSGIAGQSGSERLNDLAYTTVRSDKPHTSTEVWATNPAGIFASSSSPTVDRWINVWINGVEAIGKVLTVDKTPGSPTYGKITLDPSFRLRYWTEGTGHNEATPQGGEVLGNCSSTHYELLAADFKWEFTPKDDLNGNAYKTFRVEPSGGFFFYANKTKRPICVIPGYEQDLTASTTAWDLYAGLKGSAFFTAKPIIKPAANDWSRNNDANNDVGNFFKTVLTTAGITAGSITVSPSGYTLGALTRSQVKVSELIDGARKALLPPNYRLRELEDGTVLIGYISQTTTAQLTLRGVKGFRPKEPAKPITRAIVRGKPLDVNRAGQLLRSAPVTDPAALFDGFKSSPNDGGTGLIGVGAYLAFKIPPCEPGRYPNVSKVVLSYGSGFVPQLSGYTGSTVRYLPVSVKPNEGADSYTKEEITDLTPIALGDGVNPWGAWELGVTFQDSTVNVAYDAIMPSTKVDEIEVYLREGAYAEALLTDNTSLAPADGALGVNGFGKSWNQPNKDLQVFYRFAPTVWLKRNMVDYSAGVHQVQDVQAEGLSVAQARDVAQASVDYSVRGSEFYECSAVYDPRVQPGDTVAAPIDDGSELVLLVWGIVKEERTMQLTLADYSK